MSDLTANLPPPYSAPRPRILLNSDPLDKPIGFEVERKLTYQPATFRAEAALSFDSFQSWLWWDGKASSGALIIELQAGYLPDGAPETSVPWQSLFVGVVDHIDVSPTSGHIEMHGRDLAALLIDNQTSEEFTNQTSSQVWTTLATRRGLTPQVTETSELVRKYFEIDYTMETLYAHGRERTEWDVAVALAEIEGFDLFLDGYNLVAQPQQLPSNPYPITWQPKQAASGGQVTAGGSANTPHIRVWRDLNYSAPVKVYVHSTSAKTGLTIEGTASGGGNNGTVRTYHFKQPNLTQAQADQLAQKKVQDITRHAAGIEVEIVAPDLTIKPTTGISLSGSGTSWDQTYYVDHQRIHVSMRGAMMSMECKNVPPESGAHTTADAGGSDATAGNSSPGGGSSAGGGSAPSAGADRFQPPDGGWANQPAAQPYQSLMDQNVPNGFTRGQWYNLMGTESSFNPSATNGSSGAQGIAQVLPSTAANPGFGVQPLSNPYDPSAAIPWTSQYLNALTAQYGSPAAAVQHYSGGGYSLSQLGG